MDTLTINIDCDGVLYDFNEAMTSVGEQELQRKLPPTDRWSMWDAWGITRDEWYRLFHLAIREYDVFSFGDQVPGALNAVRYLIGEGHRIRIVTSKKLRYADSTKFAQQQTIDWLHKHGLLNDVELCFTGNKQGYPADVVIDDKPTDKWMQPGALNILFGQPWNEHWQYAHNVGTASVVRAASWGAVLREIERVAHPPTYLDLREGAGGI